MFWCISVVKATKRRSVGDPTEKLRGSGNKRPPTHTQKNNAISVSSRGSDSQKTSRSNGGKENPCLLLMGGNNLLLVLKTQQAGISGRRRDSA